MGRPRRCLHQVPGPQGAADDRLRFARLHGRARATTRRNTIYLRGSLEEFFADPELVLHEYFHVLRQWNRGRLSQWAYVREWWRHGYWQNRYERQARRFVRMRVKAYARALARSAGVVAAASPGRGISELC